MNEYLFIGGTNDGNRLKLTDPRPVIALVKYDKSIKLSFTGTPNIIFEHEYYKEVRLTNGKIIYLLDKIPEDELIERLIKGYKHA